MWGGGGGRGASSLGCTPRGLLGRVLRRFSRVLCRRFEEGFSEGRLEKVIEGRNTPFGEYDPFACALSLVQGMEG